MYNETKLRNPNKENEDNVENLEKINEEKYAKCLAYTGNILEIINRIKDAPASYAEYIEDYDKNIIEAFDKNNEIK